MEPFRIKAVEPIPLRTVEERQNILAEADYNVFRVHSTDVTIDLLTDSGTTAMSSKQWAALFLGDESYAWASSFERFERTVRELTGFPEVIPVHQGRAAEKLLFTILLRPGQTTVANGHFDSTRANIEQLDCRAVDLPCPEAADIVSEAPFKGNIDLDRLRELLDEPDDEQVALVILTVTNNGGGGQPVSLENLRSAREICRQHKVPLLLDASRFAENAHLIITREPGQQDRTPREVARAMFDLADGCWASLKKDGMSNTGGLIALRDAETAARCRESLTISEGFPTYGGLAGRDLEILVQGLHEVTDPAYLAHRADTAAWFTDALAEAGLPTLRPAGCHAVYADAGQLLPHIPPENFPGQALVCELYRQAGVRTVEFGTLTLGQDGGQAPNELVRLALPRRVYTRSHLEYVVDAVKDVVGRAGELTGFTITGPQPPMRHFTVKLTPLKEDRSPP
ncbi:tryptophanase [Streptomyces sp. Je 1-369]|uniref:tryptophanase n=1 Tax=Streptomyces sp. Je 1-369 TaxID=2966192 RepID=UPI0022861F6C|nr:tryptophanase [Streptomyces sp. Je 1-369]WAL93665.1 tryptophanase [Streptomyces sp. Je 1-369]